MPAPAVVLDLVQRFDSHATHYRSAEYKEDQLRQEFLNPFFEALGWDMANREGYAPAYREVIHEDAIKIGGNTKAPDYCFRIGGTRKYFLEAKKPAVALKNNPDAAYQLRRYAWSAKLPVSVLTNFAEFAVYECRKKPAPTDKAAVARVHYFTHADYAEKWDEVAGVFSKDAILKGSFDKYAEAARGKRGTATVDAAFLEEIEGWRDQLARTIAARNPAVTQRELNFAVQVTIDRIIFLRMCEDRGVEPYGRLQAQAAGDGVYAGLLQLFRQADDKYNSGLFHFEAEASRDDPDDLTPTLTIDDKVLKGIIKGLYYPDSPYVFSEIPADILGQVYEQFLGKVIRLTAGHQAKVEDKPEVKKAGGVYYTPGYIVTYIVEQTLGKLLGAAGMTPKLAAKLRVLDPACGSGSFLLGAYDYLLAWHLQWYTTAGPEKYSKAVTSAPGGEYRLTNAEKKRILLDNVYGVDIDPQAVEVTKLSLLLKVLEGETGASLFPKERALPDLDRNIRCGNSLIGPDYYAGRLIPDEEERLRVNAFDWKHAFPIITKAGGFDAVIGNPPYIRIQTLQEWLPEAVEYYKMRYTTASAGNYDIYVVFAEKGLSLLNPVGKLGYILPHKFFTAHYGLPLREIVANGKHLAHVVNFGDQQVFETATTYTCLMFLDNSSINQCRYAKVDNLQSWRSTGDASEILLPADKITSAEWSFSVGEQARIMEKLRTVPHTLGEIAELFVGLQTDADDIFILNEIRREGTRVLCQSKATGEQVWFEDNHLKPFLKGSLNIRRYRMSDVNKRLIFPYHIIHGKSALIDAKSYHQDFPLTWAYLQLNRERLTLRNKGRMGHEWYGYVYRKNHTRFSQPKLLVPSIATGSCFAADLAGKYYFVGSGGGGGGGYGITLRDSYKLSYFYILGVLNSSLLSLQLKQVSTPFRGGYIALNRQYIEQLRVRLIDFDIAADKSRHDRIVLLVEQMLALHVQLGAAKVPSDRAGLQQQIVATDGEIDRLVYDLYGLTADEIRIVEGAVAATPTPDEDSTGDS